MEPLHSWNPKTRPLFFEGAQPPKNKAEKFQSKTRGPIRVFHVTFSKRLATQDAASVCLVAGDLAVLKGEQTANLPAWNPNDPLFWVGV